jgi:hypothetical protein
VAFNDLSFDSLNPINNSFTDGGLNTQQQLEFIGFTNNSKNNNHNNKISNAKLTAAVVQNQK